MIELDQIPVATEAQDSPIVHRPGFAARSREMRRLLAERDRMIQEIEDLRQENRMLRDLVQARTEARAEA